MEKAERWSDAESFSLAQWFPWPGPHQGECLHFLLVSSALTKLAETPDAPETAVNAWMVLPAQW